MTDDPYEDRANQAREEYFAEKPVEGDVVTPSLHEETEQGKIQSIIRRRPGQIVPIGISFKFTVHHIGDALVTDGEKLYELGQGTWRLVSEEVYNRVFHAALVAPGALGDGGRKRGGD